MFVARVPTVSDLAGEGAAPWGWHSPPRAGQASGDRRDPPLPPPASLTEDPAPTGRRHAEEERDSSSSLFLLLNRNQAASGMNTPAALPGSQTPGNWELLRAPRLQDPSGRAQSEVRRERLAAGRPRRQWQEVPGQAPSPPSRGGQCKACVDELGWRVQGAGPRLQAGPCLWANRQRSSPANPNLRDQRGMKPSRQWP